jgi:hypothetical protein
VSVGTLRSKLPPDGNDSRTHYSRVLRVLAPDGKNSRILEGSLPIKHNFLTLKHENVIKMKNKPDPALLRLSNLSNEIKKGYKNLVRLSL